MHPGDSWKIPGATLKYNRYIDSTRANVSLIIDNGKIYTLTIYQKAWYPQGEPFVGNNYDYYIFADVNIRRRRIDPKIRVISNNPCEGIVCEPFCEGTTRYFNGNCVDGNCTYTVVENAEECGYNPCEGVVCDSICKGYDLHSQKCVDGTCVPDALLETNSPQCGYNPCEGIICNDICKEHDLHSQKCVDGVCAPDALLETNSPQCGFIPPVTIIPRERTYWIKSTLPVLNFLPGLPYVTGIPILPGFRISDKI